MRTICVIPLCVTLSAAMAMALVTAAPTGPARLIKDVRLGAGSSTTFWRVAALDGKLLFAADDGLHGAEPWVSDGTAEGTRLVEDIRIGRNSSFPSYALGQVGANALGYSQCNGRAYSTTTDGLHGEELWTTDGTEGGTRIVKDIRPGSDPARPWGFACLGSLLFFSANDGGHGHELWSTDGTEEGTQLVRDIHQGPLGSAPRLFTRFGDLAFFVADDGVTGTSLWRSDGTEAGTFSLVPLDREIDTPVVFRGALWFIMMDFDNLRPAKLWRTDGTHGGTAYVSDIDAQIALRLTVAGDMIFFQGTDEQAGTELWVTDGTGLGTHRVTDIVPGQISSTIGDLTSVGPNLFFTAYDLNHGFGLWKTDGTEAGTVALNYGVFAEDGGGLGEVAGMLLFSAFDDLGWGVWRSDGTEPGTFPIQHFGGPFPYFAPTNYLQVGTRVFFSAYEPSTGREPWSGRAAILTHQPARALKDLADEVGALDLPGGIAQSLIAKLKGAGAALARGSGAPAVLKLESFETEVQALSPSHISATAAASLLEFAGEIEALLRAQEG